MQETATAPTTEYNDLTERQQKFVQRAAELADVFATRAEQHDRDASFAFEDFEDLHNSGYARMCLPAELNGEDASLEEFSLAQERLAQGSPSTALGANMHGFFTGMVTELYKKGGPEAENWKMALMAVAYMKVTLGGAVSEAESADPLNFPSGRIERVEGGYKINGRKVFGSNTPVSPLHFFNAILEENGERKILTFQVPKGTPGANIIEDWDTMGMRATGSFSIEFKDCIVTDAMKAGEIPADRDITEDTFAAPFICWFEPSVSAVYTGIAVSARDFARNYVANRSRLPHGPVKHAPGVQYAIAEMFIGVESARAFYRRSARRLEDPGWRDLNALALATATKLYCTKQAIAVVDQAMEVVGGGSFFKRMPLERMYRDVRAGTYHPPSRFDGLEWIGKAELGIPMTQSPRFI
jgi:alkylation response protein AidB-like acyl-CoA dehydrogenase